MGLKEILEGVLGGVKESHRQNPDRFELPLPLPRGANSSRRAQPSSDSPSGSAGRGPTLKPFPIPSEPAPHAPQGKPSRPAAASRGGHDHDLLDGHVFHSVVQVVALKRGLFGGMSSAWTGSGSIVHPAGLILTNCHVANPRAMGLSAPDADGLGIAITDGSDEAPALTYLAEVVAQAPELDLAVIRITTDLHGRKVGRLDLPAIPLGDSDALDLGDRVEIYGYPGIGGETVTYTAGNVSEFSSEHGIRERRAWIKTDATIAGGNSGGMALDAAGRLIGIPTRADAGSGDQPVDARPVLDTNRDGRIDQRDTPMAVGGFINGLRPVNLAFPLLEKAGMKVQIEKTGTVRAEEPKPWWGKIELPDASAPPTLDHLLFSTQVTADGRPIGPTTFVDSGQDVIYASFEYHGMKPGTPWSVTWMTDGKEIDSQQNVWDGPAEGRKAVMISDRKGLPDGEYNLVIGLGSKVALEGRVRVGHPVDDSDSEVSGRLVDDATGAAIAGGVFIVLQGGVRAADFMKRQDRDQVLTSDDTDSQGRFSLPRQLRKGQAYSVVAGADGYEPVVIDGALRLAPGAPEKADIGEVRLSRR